MRITADDSTAGSASHLVLVNGGADGKTEGEKCNMNRIDETETRCALLANLYQSHGKPGTVSIRKINYLLHFSLKVDYIYVLNNDILLINFIVDAIAIIRAL